MNIVYRTFPRHTEDNVALDSEIHVQFMVDIHVNSFKKENIILLNITEKKVEPVTFSYSRRALKVRPEKNLLPNSHYQLQLVGGKNGIKDITGRTLVETYEVEFKTKERKGLSTPKILAPVDVSVANSLVEFHIGSVEGALYYELQVSKSNTFNNLLWPTDDQKIFHDQSLKISPFIEYETGLYYARARAVNNEAEKSGWSHIIRFFYDDNEKEPEKPVNKEEESPEPTEKANITLLTKSRVYEKKTILNELQNIFVSEQEQQTSFKVVKTNPKNKSTNKKVNHKISIQFSDDIDPDSVNEETCYVLAERN